MAKNKNNKKVLVERPKHRNTEVISLIGRDRTFIDRKKAANKKTCRGQIKQD